MKIKSLIMAAGLSLGFLTACNKSQPTANAAAPHKHEHKPPHGGTPVVLGDEECHVELVLDPATGILDAYVFDGELENYIRIAATSLELTAKLPGREEKLILKAVANNATGEKVGDTAMFETQADWLKTTKTFDAVLNQINVNGKTYQNVAFNFPKGNDTDEKEKK